MAGKQVVTTNYLLHPFMTQDAKKPLKNAGIWREPAMDILKNHEK